MILADFKVWPLFPKMCLIPLLCNVRAVCRNQLLRLTVQLVITAALQFPVHRGRVHPQPVCDFLYSQPIFQPLFDTDSVCKRKLFEHSHAVFLLPTMAFIFVLSVNYTVYRCQFANFPHFAHFLCAKLPDKQKMPRQQSIRMPAGHCFT